MEYLNDRTYRRGDDVRLEVTVEAEKAKTGDGAVYESVYACFLGISRGYRIELGGGAPKIVNGEAIIVLTGPVEHAGDDDYRAQDGVQGRIPGDTVRFGRICGVDRPLRVEGGDDQNSNTILG